MVYLTYQVSGTCFLSSLFLVETGVRILYIYLQFLKFLSSIIPVFRQSQRGIEAWRRNEETCKTIDCWTITSCVWERIQLCNSFGRCFESEGSSTYAQWRNSCWWNETWSISISWWNASNCCNCYSWCLLQVGATVAGAVNPFYLGITIIRDSQDYCDTNNTLEIW